MREEHVVRLVIRWVFATGALMLAAAPSVFAQTSRPAVRVSFFTNSSKVTPTDGSAPSNWTQFITSAAVEMNEGEGNGVEYAIDMRRSEFLDGLRNTRFSIYDAYAGVRALDGHLRARVGGMWLTELGGLGSVAGTMLEVRQKTAASGNRMRAGFFAGVEPSAFEVDYVRGVRKYGGYGVIEGAHGRQHSAGYVRLENTGLVERSVVTFSNFVPVQSRVFFYQSGEYDLVGPAGQGDGGLTYFFFNGRAQATSRVDVQGSYHRGRSIDTRSITDDILSGRPVPVSAIDGLLFESAGGRVTVEVARHVRVYGGYTRDRNNSDSTQTNRYTAGASASDIGNSGLDLTVTQSESDQATGRYGSLYLSVGHQASRFCYLSGDYSRSLSVVSFTRSDGIVIESRPFTRRIGGSAVVTMFRRASLLVTAERVLDDTSREYRLLTGLTYRFK